MKIRFFSFVSIVSLLSVASLTGCVNPNVSQTNSATETQEIQNNPCAGKAGTVGASLAEKLQGKPVLVDIYASWCPACENIAPTLSQLEQKYAQDVHFVIFDVSDKSSTAESEAKAKELGLTEFLAKNKNQTGMLTIIEPSTGKILAQHRNNPNIEDYESVLDKAISQ